MDKVLYIGIVVSMLLRGVFIAAGAAAISAASWVFYFFGAFLIYTAVKLALEGENDEEDFQEGRGAARAAARAADDRRLRRSAAWPPGWTASGC